ncbi:MAG: hypothetical protein ACKO91_04030 [Acidimicrobiales bacterium]
MGPLDLCCAEDIEFVEHLDTSGVAVERHRYPGFPYSFEVMGPTAAVPQGAIVARANALQSLGATGPMRLRWVAQAVVDAPSVTW